MTAVFRPPGTVILKKYHGQELEIKVLEAGLEYQGKVYKSIPRVAMDIVKRPINGYVFFGLTKWHHASYHLYRGGL